MGSKGNMEGRPLLPRTPREWANGKDPDMYDKATWYCLVMCLILTSAGAVYTLVDAFTNVVRDLEPQKPTIGLLETELGTLQGSLVTGNKPSGGSKSIYAFKGIPFTENPPTGANRFLASTVFKTPWVGVYDATTFKPPCYQVLPKLSEQDNDSDSQKTNVKNDGGFTEPEPDVVAPDGGNAPTPTEDCLYLNVWTPDTVNIKKASGKNITGKLKPVVFWIHGGDFRTGSTAQPVYNGANLAAETDVVVVTAAYRLGPIGFLPTTNTSSAGSGTGGLNGINDLITALNWVQNEIVAFGGNPSQVTIAGSGAGSFAACILNVSPLAVGLFQAVIMESGVCTGTLTGVAKMETGKSVSGWFNAQLNVTDVQDLQSMDVSLLQWDPHEMHGDLGLHPYTPTAYVDGWVLPDDPTNLYRHGAINVKKVIIGSNSQDSPLEIKRWFREERKDAVAPPPPEREFEGVPAEADAGGTPTPAARAPEPKSITTAPKIPTTPQEWEWAVTNYTVYLNTYVDLTLDLDTLGQMLLDRYNLTHYTEYGEHAPAYAYIQMDSDAHIVCPAQRLAMLLGNRSVDAYHYAFSYGPTPLDPASGWLIPPIGDDQKSHQWASHSAEVPFVLYNGCDCFPEDDYLTATCDASNPKAKCITPDGKWGDRARSLSQGIMGFWTTLTSSDGPHVSDSWKSQWSDDDIESWISLDSLVFKSVPTLTIDNDFQMEYAYRDQICDFWAGVLQGDDLC